MPTLDYLADQYDPNLNPTGIVNPGGWSPAPSLEQPNSPYAPSQGTPTVPQFTDPYTSEQFKNAILESPLYRQEMQNIDLWAQARKEGAAFDQEWAKKFYDLNRSQVAGSFTPAYVPSYGASEPYMKQLDELAKTAAARDYGNQQEYIKESLGSRGLSSSGQLPLELGEAKFDFDNLNKEIDIRAQARQAELDEARKNASASAAASNAAQQRSIANQLADMDLRYQYDTAGASRNAKLLEAEIAAKKGDALFSVADKLMPLYFDPSTGAYIGPGGQVVTQEQAQASVTPAAPVDPSAPTLPTADPYLSSEPGRINTPRDFLAF